MRKKILTLVIIMFLVVSFFPVTALAVPATHNIKNGYTLNLTTGAYTTPYGGSGTFTINAGDTISIEAGASVYITGTEQVVLDCGAGVGITLEDATCWTTDSGFSALELDSGSNTLTLIGDSILNGAYGAPGVRVELGTTLTILGSGQLKATGGYWGSGIGGRHSDTGEIRIIGPTIYATGGYEGAGLGGGMGSTGGNITIEDAVVFARSGEYADDIGDGNDVTPFYETKITIKGSSAVFLANDTYTVAPISSHTHFGLTAKTNGKLYGIEIPAGWTQAGGFVLPQTLAYNANGGSGSVPGSTTVANGLTLTAASADGLSNGRKTFLQWNTDPGGTGYGFYPGQEIAMNSNYTLYANWGDSDVTGVSLDQSSLSMTEQDTAQLTATVTPEGATKNDVVWYSTNPDTATVDQSGGVTAVSSGYATITAWADGMSDTCAVTVSSKYMPDKSVELSSRSETLGVGESVALTAIVSPTGAALEWYSTNPLIASVDQSGNITAKSDGAVSIVAQTNGAFDVCTVLVGLPIASEIVTTATAELDSGEASEPAVMQSEEDPVQDAPDSIEKGDSDAGDDANDAQEDTDDKQPRGLPPWAGALIGLFGAGALMGAALAAFGVFKK